MSFFVFVPSTSAAAARAVSSISIGVLTIAMNLASRIPTVFRDDYLGGLRLLTRYGDRGVLIKALPYAPDSNDRPKLQPSRYPHGGPRR